MASSQPSRPYMRGGRKRSGGFMLHYKVPLVFEPQPEGGFTVTSPLVPELVTEGEPSKTPWRSPRRLGGRHRGVPGDGEELPPNLLIADPRGSCLGGDGRRPSHDVSRGGQEAGLSRLSRSCPGQATARIASGSIRRHGQDHRHARLGRVHDLKRRWGGRHSRGCRMTSSSRVPVSVGSSLQVGGSDLVDVTGFSAGAREGPAGGLDVGPAGVAPDDRLAEVAGQGVAEGVQLVGRSGARTGPVGSVTSIRSNRTGVSPISVAEGPGVVLADVLAADADVGEHDPVAAGLRRGGGRRP